MEDTLRKYAERIEKGEITPHFTYDGEKGGLLVDPEKTDVPLDYMGFGIIKLGSEPVSLETNENEMVIVPQEGVFEAEIDGKKFFGERRGGPFAVKPGKTNASALYVPSHANMKIVGEGEVAFFQAPAFERRPPFYLSSSDVKVVSRGEWIWRRDVINLVNPKNASTNLIVGETYNPPGFWSGTPPHRHDKDELEKGESDHEEIYFFRFGSKKGKEYETTPYGVQILLDGESLKKAYIIGDRSIFAIPGGLHPVVASPFSEILYLWGLAGKGSELAMKDAAEFAYLKDFEEILRELEGESAIRKLSLETIEQIWARFAFEDDKKRLLEAMLREKGFIISNREG